MEPKGIKHRREKQKTSKFIENGAKLRNGIQMCAKAKELNNTKYGALRPFYP